VRRQRTIFATAVAAALAATVIGVIVGWGSPAWLAVPALAVATAFSEKYSTEVIIARQRFTFGMTDAFLAAALLLAPGAWVPVALVAGYWAALASLRASRIKMLFNLADFGLSSAMAVLVTMALGGPGLFSALVGVLVFAIVNYLAVVLAVALSTGRPFRRVLIETGLIQLVAAAGNASVGLLGGWLATEQPLGLLGLVVPVGLLWRSYSQQAQRVAEARLFEELAHGHEQLLGASVDTSAQVIVTAAARMFGGAEVELLFRHPEGLISYIGDEHGVSERQRADSHAFGDPWVLRALAARGVKSGVNDKRPYVSVVLGKFDQPVAVLEARRPVGAAAFTRADEQLVGVLAGQADSWLAVADLVQQADEARGEAEVYRATSRVIGHLGAETAPALVVLRESSDRLARLASRFDGPDPVSQLVGELHSVERAVASLLGAIALAQPEPDTSRADTEWTTTGRLEPVDER
jgi:hypothetical protein